MEECNERGSLIPNNSSVLRDITAIKRLWWLVWEWIKSTSFTDVCGAAGEKQVNYTASHHFNSHSAKLCGEHLFTFCVHDNSLYARHVITV
jgi:hypothetical protein